jgi:DNA-binding FadR family transcriptional regulator
MAERASGENVDNLNGESEQFARVDLVAKVTDSIRERIFSGKYEVDTDLPSEGEFATRHGVSRNVVREAMRTLRALGLVEISQGRRPRVKPAAVDAAMVSLEYVLRSSGNSLDHLIEVRCPLETEIAGLAARRATPENIEKIEQAIKELETSTNQEQRIDADINFHRLLAESSGNPVFLLLLDTVSGLLHTFHKLKKFDESRVAITASEHRAVLSAVARHDEPAARAAMTQHLEGVRASVSE